MRPRGVAAITVWLFMVSSVLAMHHEASTAHVRDRAGVLVHAETLTGHRAGHAADVHGQRDREPDPGECALLTALHQVATADAVAPAVVTPLPALTVHRAALVATITTAAEIYRLAPKTSPPVAA